MRGFSFMELHSPVPNRREKGTRAYEGELAKQIFLASVRVSMEGVYREPIKRLKRPDGSGAGNSS